MVSYQAQRHDWLLLAKLLLGLQLFGDFPASRELHGLSVSPLTVLVVINASCFAVTMPTGTTKYATLSMFCRGLPNNIVADFFSWECPASPTFCPHTCPPWARLSSSPGASVTYTTQGGMVANLLNIWAVSQ